MKFHAVFLYYYTAIKSWKKKKNFLNNLYFFHPKPTSVHLMQDHGECFVPPLGRLVVGTRVKYNDSPYKDDVMHHLKYPRN